MYTELKHADVMRGAEGIRRLLGKIPLRKVSTTQGRNSSENSDSAHCGGYSEGALPFGTNHIGFLLTGFIIFSATGLGLPFFILRHQLIKSNG